jgi:hypothetical protein
MAHKRSRASPLRDALLSGLPLALLLGAVLLLAGVPVALAAQGAAVAFGVGCALELLNARAGWAKSLGGVVTVALGLYVAVSWTDWSQFLTGEPETAQAKQALRIVAPTGSAPVGAPAGYMSEAGRPGGAAVRAPTRAEIGGAGATGRAPAEGSAGQTGAATAGGREPAAEPRAAPTPAMLVVRNDTAEEVEVWLQRPGAHSRSTVWARTRKWS